MTADGTRRQRRTGVVALALVGLALAAVITYLASTLVSQPIGLTSEPATVGESLAPAAPASTVPASTAPATTTTQVRTQTQTTTVTVPATTTATTPAITTSSGDDHHGGHDSDSDDD